MSLNIDLHAHSTFSDGTLTPTELFQRAQAAGLKALALTDHDTTEGIAEARTAAAALGIILVPGVEISVTWMGRTIHLTGLNLDPACLILQDGLAALRRFRDWRAEEIGRRLDRNGVTSAYEGAKALSNGRLITRTHFARYLVETGHCADLRRVFQKYLAQGKTGHVAGQWADLADAVAWIRAAGGQAVIAHPARYRLTRSKFLRLVHQFKEAGGNGLEVVSGSHSQDDCFVMARHAVSHGLLASAGSDYHGPENPWVELGRLSPLPEGLTPIWHNWGLELGTDQAVA